MSNHQQTALGALFGLCLGVWIGLGVRSGGIKPEENWVSTGTGYTIVNTKTGELRNARTGERVGPVALQPR